MISRTTTKYFSAAVRKLVTEKGHGAQADLARKAIVSTSYLNDLIAGRKEYWPDRIKERVAGVLGYSVAQLLEMGREIEDEK